MSEQSIQSSILKYLQGEGWLTFKTISCSPSGYPDVIAHRNGETILIEVKDKYGKLSPVQVEQHKRLTAQGITVITAKSKGDVIASLTERNI